MKVLKLFPIGPGKRGHIVARDVSRAAQTGKHLLRTQNLSEQNQKHFCIPDTKFVSATNVARAGKRGNICVRNNVSSFVRALSPVAMDGMDGSGLKLEKNGQFIRVLMLHVQNILKKFIMVSPL